MSKILVVAHSTIGGLFNTLALILKHVTEMAEQLHILISLLFSWQCRSLIQEKVIAIFVYAYFNIER